MDKKAIGIIGAISVMPLAAVNPATAKTVDDIMNPQSYADLLRPIPNATEVLEKLSRRKAPEVPVQMAQYYGGPYYGGPYDGGPYYHHHHHHHHHYYGYGWGYGGPYYHHHHHHHHHHDWGW